jgi:hypothetical protein
MANSPAAASRGSSEFTERPGARGSTQGLSDDTPSIEYPVGCSPFFHTASDIEYYDRLFSNPKNFSSETECDIFHAQNGKTEWMENVNEAEILQHLSVSSHRRNGKMHLAKYSPEGNRKRANPCASCHVSVNRSSSDIDLTA